MPDQIRFRGCDIFLRDPAGNKILDCDNEPVYRMTAQQHADCDELVDCYRDVDEFYMELACGHYPNGLLVETDEGVMIVEQVLKPYRR